MNKLLLNSHTTTHPWKVRPDGLEKVTGQLKYLTDMKTEGCLYGKIKRSGLPHARLIEVDTSKAEALPGVHAVLTSKDIPGLNGFGIADPNQPVFCEDLIRFEGDAVAAIAAESPETAEEAASLIRIKTEPLPVISSPEEALQKNAPRLHKEGNTLHTTSYKRGETEHVLKECSIVVEDSYDTPRQMHVFMETEGGLFVPEKDGSLTVFAPTQHGYKDRMQLARILGWSEAQIRIVSSPIGGSFGGKDELNVQPYGALLAVMTGRAVKIHYSREESVRAGIKRHPMKIHMKTGADKNGRILAHEVSIISDTGAYATLGGPVLNFATEHAIGGYDIPHVEVNGKAVYTNNGISGEFRGFGGNQVIFALEGQMDRIAEKLNVDPWSIRRKNLRQVHDYGPLGQRIVPNDGPRQVWKAIQQSPLWKKPSRERDREEPWIVKGRGAALAMHGSGLGYGIPDPSGGRLQLSESGKIEAAFGFEECGQGLISSMEIMLTEAFKCSTEDTKITIGDTALVPSSGSTTASRATNMVWKALQNMKQPFKEKLYRAASALTGESKENMQTGRGGIWKKGQKEETFVCSYKDLAGGEIVSETEFHFPVTPDAVTGGHYLYGSTAVVVEVEVNRLTGSVRVTGADHAVSAGKVINPIGYLGQIEGGSIMALGFTLSEDAIMKNGSYETPNMDTYLVPTIRDVPDTQRVDAVEELAEGDNYGPRGVGEIGSVALAPAIIQAVHAATGVRISSLPLQAEELVDERELLALMSEETREEQTG